MSTTDQKPAAQTAALTGFADDIFASVKTFVMRSVRPLQAKQEKTTEAISTLAAVCAEVPQRLQAIERRLHDLESGQHGR